jgi:hypothetical protein
MSPLELCQWVQDTQIGTAIRESTWVFPIILAFHSLGLALSVGTVLWLDLRLLGIKMRGLPVSEVYRQLKPWMLSGFAIMFLSGLLLFSAQAARCYQNVYCRSKILLLVVPGLNALIYHLVTERSIARWDRDVAPPLPARMAGFVSLVSWTVIIVLGRQIVF